MNYFCYLGNCEQHRYSVEARNFKDLRKKLVAKFNWGHYRWYKNVVPKGYPRGSLRFILKEKSGKFEFPNLGRMRRPLLIIKETLS